MSLINDALRRAKEAQQQAPPPATPPPAFRPVEHGEQHRHPRVAGALPAMFAIFALVALFLVWRFSHSGVRARSHTASEQQSPAAAQTTISAQPAAASTDTTVAHALTNEAPAAPIAVVQSPAPPSTAVTAAPDPVPPKPAPLRLQAILYHPRHPSALVSGKTLFIGDRIGELRLVALDKESVTLIGGGQTNVLNLVQ